MVLLGDGISGADGSSILIEQPMELVTLEFARARLHMFQKGTGGRIDKTGEFHCEQPLHRGAVGFYGVE